jgi:NADPH:quinone reductase-like Zn-dependent oxidoreductase
MKQYLDFLKLVKALPYFEDVLEDIEKEEGVKHILVETEEGFGEKLRTLCLELEATTAFDAVGGTQTGMMFNAMPTDSELILYGGLSNKPASGLDTLPLIFNQKTIYGFSLPDWKEELYDFEEISEYLQDLFIKGTLQTKIQGSTSIDKVVKGLRNYITNMSGGKVLIKPV